MELADWHMWWKRSGARELRALLMEHWDPIGVAGVAEAADEYDAYLGHVAGMLRDGASVDDVAAYLRSVRVDNMGLGGSRRAKKRESEAARHIAAWYDAAMR